MKSARFLASASLLILASAGVLRADQKTWLGFCTPGALRACSSIQVVTNLIAGGTSVTIRVRNEQGGFGGDNTGGSIISRIGIVAPTITGASGLTVTGVSGAGTFGNPGSQWVLRNPGHLGGLIELTAGISNIGAPGGIAGCAAPWGGAPASYFQTCNGGWVELTFTTTNSWSANNAEVAVLSSDFAVNGQATECSTIATASNSACVMATPEPVTMILLGSGLAGMGGMGLIRRRKGADVISD